MAHSRPIMIALDLLSRRWTLRVIWELGVARSLGFATLQERCNISPTVLSKRLSELTAAAVVVHDGREYRLSETGQGLLKILLQLSSWSDDWVKLVADPGAVAPAGAPDEGAPGGEQAGAVAPAEYLLRDCDRL